MNTLEYLAQRFSLDLSRKIVDVRGVNRTIMAQVLGYLGFVVGAEIGVAQGWHAEILCRENPAMQLFAVDVWERYEGYGEYKDRIDRYYLEAQARLAPYRCALIKKFSREAAQKFADGSLDFVYIDAAHDFESVAVDLCQWARKVRPGGIVFGHDYKRWNGRSRYIVQVKDVVQAFAYAHKVRPLLVLTNDVRDPLFGMDAPGWAFVRQADDWIAK